MTLERLTGHRLRRATISDVLNGNRVRIPDWPFVAAFVLACRTFAEESGLDPQELGLGTVSDWKRHWDLASTGRIDTRFPGRLHRLSTDRPADETERPAEESSRPAEESGRLAREPGRAAGDSGRTPGEAAAGVAVLAADAAAPAAARAGRRLWGRVPSRMTDFVGRESWLASVHRALTTDGGTSAVAIQGFCGIGKTQLAIEYAHRYKADYDLIWWLPCDTPEAAREALTELETRLQIPDVPRAPGESRYAGLFEFLQQGHVYARWLLIFDNANEPDDIRDLIPQRDGHILITSRNSRWEATGDMLELGVFSRDESIEFLRRRRRDLGEAGAHRLAEASGDLPLVLEHAIESHMPVERYIARLDTDPLRLLDSQPADYPATIADEWRRIINRLRADSMDALDLLRCLSFFGSEAIPRESLYRGRYFQEISISPMLSDSIRASRAILMLQRAGLLRVQAVADTLELHRLTRYIIRHMVARDLEDSVARWEHDVHLLLAAADPGNPYDPADWRGYDDLRGHARQSRAEKCHDEPVRKLIVNLVRSQCARGDPHGALSWADRALHRWSASGQDDHPEASDGYLAMQQARAEALFACGQHAEAARQQRGTLALMAASPGKWAEEMTLLHRMTAADCRVKGDFTAAEEVCRESVRQHVDVFGQDHPQAFSAIDSLVLGLALNGKYADAIREAERVYIDCLAFYGDSRYPLVLFAYNSLGRCRWLAGQYGEALGILTTVHAGYAEIVAAGYLDANHPWLLTHETDYAAVRRDAGFPGTDPEALARDMHDVHRRCWRALSVNHPQTLAAAVTLGSVLRRIEDRVGESTEMIADAEQRYWSALPEHPYAHACSGLRAAMRWRSAAHQDTALAVTPLRELEQVIARLTAIIGADHPCTLTMVATLANIQADMGYLDRALVRGRQAMTGFRRRLGENHPLALACEANVTTLRARLGQDTGAAALSARYAAALGPDHPDSRLFSEGRLVDIDFTPVPLLRSSLERRRRSRRDRGGEMPIVSANGIEINYEVTGAGEPLVLIPYLAADQACYAFQVAEYAKHFTCFTVDLRGAGLTSKPEGTYTTELLADDVAAFMQAAGIDRAHVSGLSLGAATGMWLAAKYPERVKSLSLHSPWPATDHYLKTVVEGWQVMAQGLGSVTEMVIKGIFPWCFTPELYAARPEYIDALADFVRGRPMPAVDAFLRQSGAVIGHDAAARLELIQAPAQVTFGRHDAVTSPRFAAPLTGAIKGAELFIFEDCSHAPIYENVEAFNTQTLAFLRRHCG
jgi:pimeloyl-ACP methyl ester carboxylesterase